MVDEDDLKYKRYTPTPDEDTIVIIQVSSASALNSSMIIVSTNTIESLLDSSQSQAEMLESQGDNPRNE